MHRQGSNSKNRNDYEGQTTLQRMRERFRRDFQIFLRKIFLLLVASTFVG